MLHGVATMIEYGDTSNEGNKFEDIRINRIYHLTDKQQYKMSIPGKTSSVPRDGWAWLDHVWEGGGHIRAYIKMRMLEAGEIAPHKDHEQNREDMSLGMWAEEYLKSDDFRVWCKIWDWNSNYLRKKLFGGTIEDLKGYYRQFSQSSKLGRAESGKV